MKLNTILVLAVLLPVVFFAGAFTRPLWYLPQVETHLPQVETHLPQIETYLPQVESPLVKPTAQERWGRFLDTQPDIKRALTLLRLHESLDGSMMIGDGGAARGWLQQHKAHWQEGCKAIGVSWSWPKDTSKLWKCEVVAYGYWKRHAPVALKEGNVEELVRRFRLPYAPYRKDNDLYAVKVLGE